MRKTVVIAIAALVVVVGGVVGGRSWLETRERNAEVGRRVAVARDLMSSEKGLSQAAVELDAALLIAPDNVPALLARGEVALRLSQVNDAIANLDKAALVSEGSDLAKAQLLRGLALAERYRGANRDEDFRAANNSFLAARNEPSLEAEAIEGTANLFLQPGRNQDFAKARRSFEELLQKHPDYGAADQVREILEVLRKAGQGG